jgi:glutamine amidotransferase
LEKRSCRLSQEPGAVELTKPMLTILSYGLGNIKAISNIYTHLGVPHQVAETVSALKSATSIIMPGVGSFDWAMQKLQESGLREELESHALGRGTPILGICVGMQMLGKSSEEGHLPGLGWIDAEVQAMQKDDNRLLPFPHMGWNAIRVAQEHPLFVGIQTPEFYFLHSFCMKVNDQSAQIAMTQYNIVFASAVAKNNIMGVQFHPEKSHASGIQLMRNFAGIAAC